MLELLRLRHGLVRQRTMCLNRLQWIRTSFGLPKRKLGSTLLTEISGMNLPFSYATSRDVQLSLLGELNSKIEEVEKILLDLFRIDQRAQLLGSHFGVGYLTALCFVHTVGDPERFRNKRRLVGYLGLDPVESSSAGKQRFGSISKRGSRLLRFLLVQSAQIAVRRRSGTQGVLLESLKAARQAKGQGRNRQKASRQALQDASPRHQLRTAARRSLKERSRQVRVAT